MRRWKNSAASSATTTTATTNTEQEQQAGGDDGPLSVSLRTTRSCEVLEVVGWFEGGATEGRRGRFSFLACLLHQISFLGVLFGADVVTHTAQGLERMHAVQQ